MRSTPRRLAVVLSAMLSAARGRYLATMSQIPHATAAAHAAKHA